MRAFRLLQFSCIYIMDHMGTVRQWNMYLIDIWNQVHAYFSARMWVVSVGERNMKVNKSTKARKKTKENKSSTKFIRILIWSAPCSPFFFVQSQHTDTHTAIADRSVEWRSRRLRPNGNVIFSSSVYWLLGSGVYCTFYQLCSGKMLRTCTTFP